MINPKIGKNYDLVRRLAVGGMGEVLLAETEGDPRTGLSPGLVVVKRTLPKHPNREHQNAMLREEGRVSLRLRHANIVETFGMDVADESPIVIMEYLAGRSMAQVLGAAKRNQEMVPIDVALRVLHDAACGLHFAHTLRDGTRDLGLVHRDVSPANIIVTFDGRVKVIDFGVAKADDSQIRTSTGVLKGKIGYMSPEHSKGEKLDPRADLWSLGVLTWESLVADRLFSHRNPALTLARINDGPIPRASERREELPASVDDIVMKLLTRPLEDRFESGADVVRTIEKIRDIDWRNADLVGFLKTRFPADFAKGTEEVKRAASISGEPAPTGLVEMRSMSDEEVEAATIVADRRDLLSLARSMIDPSDETSETDDMSGMDLDDDDDLRTVQMSSEDVQALFGSEPDGAPEPSHLAAALDEIAGDRTMPVLDPSLRPSDPKAVESDEYGGDTVLAPNVDVSPTPSTSPSTSATTRPGTPSSRPVAATVRSSGPAFTAPAPRTAQRRRRRAGSFAVAAAAFGAFALVVGIALSVALPATRDEALVCVREDGANTASVIACIDRGDAPSVNRVNLASPTLPIAGRNTRISSERFQAALGEAQLAPRARLPYTLKERRQAGFGPVILWLGLLALGFALPALFMRGASSLIARIGLMLGATALLFIFYGRGFLSWPGADVLQPSDLAIPTATFAASGNAP